MESQMKKAVLLLVVGLVVVSVVYAQSQVIKKNVAGVTNFAEVESTVACAGAATPASMAEIKKMGYKISSSRSRNPAISRRSSIAPAETGRQRCGSSNA